MESLKSTPGIGPCVIWFMFAESQNHVSEADTAHCPVNALTRKEEDSSSDWSGPLYDGHINYLLKLHIFHGLFIDFLALDLSLSFFSYGKWMWYCHLIVSPPIYDIADYIYLTYS